MSTRATYKFTAPYKPEVTFYIHHDGYPEGAARYLQHGSKSPEEFIRRNDRAEITPGHTSHGDTEYRYDITILEQGKPYKTHIHAIKRTQWEGSKTWETVYSGTMKKFLENYAPKKAMWQEEH